MRFRNFVKNSFPLLEMGHRWSPKEDGGWRWELNDGAKNLISLIIGPKIKQAQVFKWIMWQGLVSASQQRDKLVDAINQSGKLSEKIVPVDLFSPIAHQRNGGELGRLWDAEIKHQWQEPTEMILDDGTKILIDKVNEKLEKMGLEPFYYGGPNGFMQHLEKADFGTKFSKSDPNNQQGPDLSEGKFVQLANGAIVPEFYGFKPPEMTRAFTYVLDDVYVNMAKDLDNEKETLNKFKNVIQTEEKEISLALKAGLHDKSDGVQQGEHTESEVEGQLQVIKIGLTNGNFVTKNPVNHEECEIISIKPSTIKTKQGVKDVAETTYKFSPQQVEKMISDMTLGGKLPKKIYKQRVKNPCVFQMNGSGKLIDITARSGFTQGEKVLGREKTAKLIGLNKSTNTVYSLKDSSDKNDEGYIFSPNYKLVGKPLPIGEIKQELESQVSEDGQQKQYYIDWDEDENENKSDKKRIFITNGYDRVQLKKVGNLWQRLANDESKPYKPYKPKEDKPYGWLPPGEQFVISGRGNTMGFSQGHQVVPRNNSDFDAIIEDMKLHPEAWGEPKRSDGKISSLNNAAENGLSAIAGYTGQDKYNLKNKFLGDEAYTVAVRGLQSVAADDRILYGDEWMKWEDLDPRYIERIRNATITNKLQSNDPSKENYILDDDLEKLRKSGYNWRLSHIKNYVARTLQQDLNKGMKQHGQNDDGVDFDHSEKGNFAKAKNNVSKYATKTNVINANIAEELSKIGGVKNIQVFYERVQNKNFSGNNYYAETYGDYKNSRSLRLLPNIESDFNNEFKFIQGEDEESVKKFKKINCYEAMAKIDATYDYLIELTAVAYLGAESPGLKSAVSRLVPFLVKAEQKVVNHTDFHDGDEPTEIPTLFNEVASFYQKIESFLKNKSQNKLADIQNQDDTVDSNSESYEYLVKNMYQQIGKMDFENLTDADRIKGRQYLNTILKDPKWSKAIEEFQSNANMDDNFFIPFEDEKSELYGQDKIDPSKIEIIKSNNPSPLKNTIAPMTATPNDSLVNRMKLKRQAAQTAPQQQPSQPEPEPFRKAENTHQLNMKKFHEWILER